MQCENVFCLYWENSQCCLQETALDIQGKCKNCLYVEIEENLLQHKRSELLCKLENPLSKR